MTPASTSPASSASASPHDWLDLGGRVCALTGAAGGIGREIALSLAAAGAHVALLDRDEAPCHALADEIGRAG